MLRTTPRIPITGGIALPAVLGVVHFVVDASSNFVVAGSLGTRDTSEFVTLLFLYNVLAFALQPLVGLATDYWRAPQSIMSAGLLLAAAAMVVANDAGVLAIVLTGFGNALFHVGAGMLASRSNDARAAGLGIFIGPGALGVVTGAAAARSLPAAYWMFLLALVAMAPLGALLPNTKVSHNERREAEASYCPRSTGVLVLLLTAIAGRAFLGARVGAIVAHQFATSLVFALAVAACLGKVFGGVIADRTGWRPSSVGFLVASCLSLSFGTANLWLVLCGIALFQAVTSITLAALYRVLPKRTGLAFGLACLALFVGSLPALLRLKLACLERAPTNAILALLSAIAIWLALWLLDRPRMTSVSHRRVAPSVLD